MPAMAAWSLVSDFLCAAPRQQPANLILPTARVDFARAGFSYSAQMKFDISQLLANWDYQPGQLSVRRFKGRDGLEKLQLRVDLGLLQMNAEGRPDGKRPMGHESLLEFHQVRLEKHLAAHGGDTTGFTLSSEDCSKLQIEALQYHHRYICLLELEDHEAVLRDTRRNLAVFDFVAEHTDSEELSWALQQFRPQLLLIQIRARASAQLAKKNFKAGIAEIERGVVEIKRFFAEHGRSEFAENGAEITYLEGWLNDLNNRRPLTKREKLELALHEAVTREDYEKAAEVRDALRRIDET
jgi:hypothetical protein